MASSVRRRSERIGYASEKRRLFNRRIARKQKWTHRRNLEMAHIHPFKGLRPARELVSKVASPPYDVLSSQEAREMAAQNDLSFLHVVKPEIDLDPEIDQYDDEVYEKGAENLSKLQEKGALIRDESPCFYLYQQHMGEHVQTGLVAGASIEEYEKDLIKKHELTRTAKEKDRIRHIETQNAQAGPVFLTYRCRSHIKSLVEEVRATEPEYDFAAPDGVRHTVWVIRDSSMVKRLQDAFAQVDTLYVADGHHRSAAGTLVGKKRREANPAHTGNEEYNFFLSVIFPHDELQILPYNRVVKDLGGRSPAAFLEALEEFFEVEEADAPAPRHPHHFGLYLDGKWHRLVAKPKAFDRSDPVKSLDVSILQERVLAPLLGIKNPRTDDRVDFVGGIRGTGELEKRCAEGWAAAFALYPTTVEQLLSVADAGKIMPPKSTWFEPKLRSGIVVHPLD
jgi:uncharacterized protein (DUF1015 family)